MSEGYYNSNDIERQEREKEKEKKTMTTGRKWASVVAMALVFGLVAGGTMFGVNTAAEHLTGRDKAQIGQTRTTSAGTDSSLSDSSAAQGTVAEVAQNAQSEKPCCNGVKENVRRKGGREFFHAMIFDPISAN